MRHSARLLNFTYEEHGLKPASDKFQCEITITIHTNLPPTTRLLHVTCLLLKTTQNWSLRTVILSCYCLTPQSHTNHRYNIFIWMSGFVSIPIDWARSWDYVLCLWKFRYKFSKRIGLKPGQWNHFRSKVELLAGLPLLIEVLHIYFPPRYWPN